MFAMMFLKEFPNKFLHCEKLKFYLAEASSGNFSLPYHFTVVRIFLIAIVGALTTFDHIFFPLDSVHHKSPVSFLLLWATFNDHNATITEQNHYASHEKLFRICFNLEFLGLNIMKISNSVY